jgi:hypothetical protein
MTRLFNFKYTFINMLVLSIFISFSFTQDWEADYESVPFDNEFSATIAAAQVFIDGVEQTDGQLAAFGEDGEISALDANGSTFFPPGGTNVSQEKSAERTGHRSLCDGVGTYISGPPCA